MKLFSSVPPSILRTTRAKCSTQNDVRDHIIKSWRHSGFVVHSINTNAELERSEQLVDFFQINQILSFNASYTASINFPDYLPNLLSFFQVIDTSSNNEYICIANSDIYFSAIDINCLLAVLGESRKNVILGFRKNISSMDILSNNMPPRSDYQYGIDVFVFHSSLLSGLLTHVNPLLTFGLPWWDILLPIYFSCQGVKFYALENSPFLHISHSARSWDPSYWNVLGLSSISQICSKELNQAFAYPSLYNEFILACSSIMQGKQLFPIINIKNYLRSVIYRKRVTPYPVLKQIAFAYHRQLLKYISFI